jgi:PAS domain S-box-containing protein
MPGSPFLRSALLNLLAAASLAALGRACLALQALSPSLPALWLPAGLALSLLVFAGTRVLPGVWVGSVAAISPLAGLFAASLAGAGETASAWLGAMLLGRLLPDGLTRGGTTAPVRFLLLAYGCSALAALCGPMVLRAFDGVPPAGMDAAIVAWWLGEALGIVVLAPAALAWRETAPAGYRLSACGAAPIALAAATAAFGFLTFVAGYPILSNPYLQSALLLPPMMLLAMRCHPAIPYSLALVLIAMFAQGAGGGFGPLLGATAVDRAYALHGFALLAGMSVLFLSAHIAGVRRMAAAATAGEERFRRLTALTSDWYWEQDRDFRFTCMEGAALGEASRLQAQFLGKRREELPGFEPYNMSWEAHQADLDAHRMFHGLVLRYERSDGRTHYYSISGEPVYDEGGAFAGYRGVGRDITPEIESREALLASERQFHDVADATFEALFVLDHGRIVFVNRACCEIAESSAERLVGRSILEFVAPEEHEKIIGHLTRNDAIKHYETIGRTANGRHFPVEVFGRPFVFEGRPMRIIAIRDNSDRQRTEAALRGQIEFQRTLLDTIPSPVFYKDRAGRYLGYNRAFADSLGVGADEYIGRTVLDLLPGETGRRLAAADERLYDGAGTQQEELSIETRHGRRDVVIYKGIFADANNRPAGMVGVVADITDRKKSEQRLRRFQELSPAAIGIVGTSGEVLYMNPTAFDLFGYRIEDVPNMEAWWQLAYPDPAYRADRYAAWIAAVELTLREGRYMFRFDGRVRCMDGRDRWIETMVSLGEDEIFMIFTDLTDYVGAGAA